MLKRRKRCARAPVKATTPRGASPCQAERSRAWNRRIGRVDEISRETCRGPDGVHGRKARRAAWRKPERP
jgi:hypothetical protein